MDRLNSQQQLINAANLTVFPELFCGKNQRIGLVGTNHGQAPYRCTFNLTGDRSAYLLLAQAHSHRSPDPSFLRLLEFDPKLKLENIEPTQCLIRRCALCLNPNGVLHGIVKFNVQRENVTTSGLAIISVFPLLLFYLGYGRHVNKPLFVNVDLVDALVTIDSSSIGADLARCNELRYHPTAA